MNYIRTNRLLAPKRSIFDKEVLTYTSRGEDKQIRYRTNTYEIRRRLRLSDQINVR